jgi:hypothetical protein
MHFCAISSAIGKRMALNFLHKFGESSLPKEMKVETAHTTISSLTDEQLQAMVHELQERISAKLSGDNAKVISAEPLPAPTTLPQPTRP